MTSISQCRVIENCFLKQSTGERERERERKAETLRRSLTNAASFPQNSNLSRGRSVRLDNVLLPVEKNRASWRASRERGRMAPLATSNSFNHTRFTPARLPRNSVSIDPRGARRSASRGDTSFPEAKFNKGYLVMVCVACVSGVARRCRDTWHHFDQNISRDQTRGHLCALAPFMTREHARTHVDTPRI